jgi:hypothetical protein
LTGSTVCAHAPNGLPAIRRPATVFAGLGNGARRLLSPALEVAVSILRMRNSPVFDRDAGSNLIVSRSGRSLRWKRVYIIVFGLFVCARGCSVAYLDVPHGMARQLADLIN